MRYRNSDFLKDLYYKREQFVESLKIARKASYSTYVNSVRKFNNLPCARRINGDIKIQEIFKEHWNEFLELNKDKDIRASILENVSKMIKCSDMDEGFLYFECPNCSNFHIQAITCKSRFCPSCGKKYRDKISISVSKKLYKIPHRQLVFTMPYELRKYFRIDRKLLSILFSSVNQTLVNFLKSKAKKAYITEHRQLGYISFLHTYGRDMKWHPHIHVLYAERFLKLNGSFGNFYYLNFEVIRKTFLYNLTHNMVEYCKTNKTSIDLKDLRQTIKDVFIRCKDGAYFYGKQNKFNYSIKSTKAMANYIARYASHPAISERRILKWDKVNKTITWFYEPHEDDTKSEEEKIGKQIITESVFEFIKRLIIHIPDKSFQQIRYYGFYSNKSKNTSTYSTKLFSNKDIEHHILHLEWKFGLLYSFGYNPLLCECGHEMVYNCSKSYFPKAGIP